MTHGHFGRAQLPASDFQAAVANLATLKLAADVAGPAKAVAVSCA